MLRLLLAVLVLATPTCVQEFVVGAPYQMGTGLVFVYNSEQF
jgi:hypothetical protein